ncbi:hypothetical protein I7I50_01909 [Histoplasma capsulatum G186AR]|uniref:Uncharacterized protein n=1 Tax=Ajellomyces capsulatus TaxID=5037 RepID=A0A8H7Y9Z6_AJECA|nr:hypothetical protein I7I52_12123 [Histoplasma capsulatum]QSS71169.1 hypothetical protein I7I50_01909 [Histoplasma capsulatum G186AR]
MEHVYGLEMVGVQCCIRRRFWHQTSSAKKPKGSYTSNDCFNVNKSIYLNFPTTSIEQACLPQLHNLVFLTLPYQMSHHQPP